MSFEHWDQFVKDQLSQKNDKSEKSCCHTKINLRIPQDSHKGKRNKTAEKLGRGYSNFVL